MHDTASEVYNELLEIYSDEYNELADAKKRKLNDNYDPESLFLKEYDYSVWSENKEQSTGKEESTD